MTRRTRRVPRRATRRHAKLPPLRHTEPPPVPASMNSDDYFNDELDSAFLDQLDAIEAAAASPTKIAKLASQPRSRTSVIEISDSDPFDAFDFNIAELHAIHEKQNYAKAAQPIAGPSNVAVRRTSSKSSTVQTTLFGDVLHEDPAKLKSNKPSSKAPMERSASSSRNLFGGHARKTKQWDHTAFAKTGWKQSAAEKAKKKARMTRSFDDEENGDDEEEPVEFEQFPAPFVPVGPSPPMKVHPDLLAAKRWIYPLNQSKRDYQFNIVKHCLFDNTLVALPTGMGKTFIAGVVMLNFYRWFPEGKVIFLAPSKPLVAQQIEACHKTCGIPGSQAAEITGEIPMTKRLKLWAEKRVFYMTPQTLLSGFTSNLCDPLDIVLIVVDEAHKGTGDYAYAQVIRYMMAKNPHFRVLALTATPGSDPESVQSIVDCLHISHIEIRDEESMDLRAYSHRKSFHQHIITMDANVVRIRDLLAKIMQPLIKQIQNNGAMRGSADPTLLHPFRCQTASGELRQRKAPPWAVAAASKLHPLARAMAHLLEGSIGMCYSVLNGILSGYEESSGKKSGSRNSHKALQNDAVFQTLIKEIEMQKNRGFTLHPKMEKLRTLLIDHFSQIMLDREEGQAAGRHSADAGHESRVMVFVSYRECVDEVVDMLNKENPLIRATRFIGQGMDKQGRKGFAQSEQLEIIKKFKTGEFNVLVSTSIGEEGLDIGEIDMIVCYDAQKTPIRMLQRIGRTGRKRDGAVHILLAEGREERNWDKAQDKYKDVQHFIVKADQLELYGDAKRLLPDHIKPECSEMVMDVEEYIRDIPASRKGSRTSPIPESKKRRRDDDPDRNIPPGASKRFVNVLDLVVKGAAKKSKKCRIEKELDILACEDDDDDLEIEAGLFGPRRAASTSAATAASKSKQSKRAKSTTATNGGQPSIAKRKGKARQVAEPTLSQLGKMGAEDSDDLEIQKGLHLPDSDEPLRESRARGARWTPSPDGIKPLISRRLSSAAPGDDVIDISTPDPPYRTNSLVISLSSSPDQPLRSRSVSEFSGEKIAGQSPRKASPSSSSGSVSAPHEEDGTDMAWLVDDDEEPDLRVIDSPPLGPHRSSPVHVDTYDSPASQDREKSPSFRSVKDASPSPIGPRNSNAEHAPPSFAMPPPALPARFETLSPSHSDEAFPEPTFAVRPPGRRNNKRMINDVVDSSPLQMPPSSQRRLQHRRVSSSPPPIPRPPKEKRRKFKDYSEAQKRNPWIDVEATHSGDERSVGSSDVDRPLDEYDSDFVQELPETQVSPSYDQSAVYRRSLLTQVPGSSRAVPRFADAPVRRGLGAFARGPSRAPPIYFSSPRGNEEEDDYEFGSFIVKDDAEISFAGDSSSEH